MREEREQSPVRRILLRVAYDGTAYHGWQLQPGDVTVEQTLNQALRDLTGEDICVIGASRTDAGVHARGNVAVFDTSSRIPAEKFSYALNPRLPEDIVIQESAQVAADFHPRRCSCEKTYEYTILNRRFPLPEYRHTAHFEYGALDLDKMRTACKAFTGEHDFAAFCSVGAQVKSTVRTIYSLEVEDSPLTAGRAAFMPDGRGGGESDTPAAGGGAEGRLITIRVRGNGFLYNMVRIIAGTLIEVGKGRIAPESIESMIASRDRAMAGPTAPAKGLKLDEIIFQENPGDCAGRVGNRLQ